VSYVKLGQFLEAEQYFTQAIAHDRESAKAFYLYGMFLIQQQNRLDQGLRQLDQAVKLDPHDLKILFDSSRLFARGKMAARALRLAQQAVQLAPDDEAAVSWLKELQKTGGRG
jgi:tetratricopeptide (TPR) repeat protein